MGILKKPLSVLIAIIMLFSMTATGLSTAFADPAPAKGPAPGQSLEEYIEDCFDEYSCVAHGKLDLMFNFSSSVTEENLLALVKSIFDLPDTVEVGFYDDGFFDFQVDVKQAYGGAGDLGYSSDPSALANVWIDLVPFCFTDTVTDEYVEYDIDLCLHKVLMSGELGYPNGVRAVCPDEADPAFRQAGYNFAAFDGTETAPAQFNGDLTPAGIEAEARKVTGLNEANAYPFFIFGYDATLVETGMDLTFGFIDESGYNPDGAVDIIQISTFMKLASDPLEQDIDDRYEDLICVAHSKLDLQFGNSGTLTKDTLNALLTELFGYPAEISDFDFDEIKSSYGGAGNGDSLWYDEAEITFTNPDTGSEYTKIMDLSIRKDLFGKYSGAVEAGALSVCPEDWGDDINDALDAIGDFDDSTVITIPGRAYTLAAIEEYFRGLTGLDGEWTFYIDGFDADEAYTGNYVTLAFLHTDYNDEGRTFTVDCECVLKINQPTDLSLQEKVDDALDELCCVAHGRLDFIFNFSPNFTEERLLTLVRKTLGLPDTVEASWYDDEFSFQEEIKNDYMGSGSMDYGREPHNLACCWFDLIPFRFTDTVSGEVYDVDIDLAIYKVTPAAELGYLEGVRTLCPDERDEAFHTAGYALEALDGTEADPVIFDGELTPAGIEAKARELTGLDDADAYPFFIVGYDADKIYTGMNLSFGFFDRSGFVPDDALDLLIIHDTWLIKVAAADTMEEDIDDLYEDLICVAHGKLDFMCGTSGTLELLEAALTEVFGYEASIDPYDLQYLKDDYGGLGGNQTAWPDTIEVTFTNPATGGEYVKEMDFALYKALHGYYSGAITDKVFLGMCPDEWPTEITNAMSVITGWGEDARFVLEGDEYTPDAVEAWYRQTTGLDGDEWTFYLNWFDDSDPYAGNDVALALVNHDVEGEGRTVIVAIGVILSIAQPAVNDPMPQEIDDRFEELACVAHGKLDLAFGTSGTITAETLGNLLTDLFGYTAEVDDSEIDRIKNEYGGLGGGQTAWVDAVEVTFYNDTLGTEYVKEMDMAFFKNLFQKYSGAVPDAGTLTVCPDEYPDDINAALAIVAPYNDEYVLTLPGSEYTEAVIEEYFRDLLGLDDDWTFHLNWFDASAQYTGNDVAIGFKYDDVNGEGRTYVIGYEIVLKIEEPVNDPMPQEIDDRYDELVCIAHSKLDLQFGNSGTLTKDTLNALLTELFGYDAEISDFDFDEIKSAYGGAGNGGTLWYDEAEITFTNPATGSEYVKSMDLAIRKSLFGKYSGAVESGALSVCPEDWGDDINDALDVIGDYDDSTVVVIPGGVFSEGAVEAYFRNLTGLGLDWTFFINGFDADEAQSGNYVTLAFLNTNYNDEGRTFTVDCECVLKAEQTAEDPMPQEIDDRFEELACVAHGKLDLAFGTSGTITTDTLGALLTELFGYTAEVDASEIDRIKGEYGGLGGGQTAWVDAVEVTFYNDALGTEYVKEMDMAFFKNLFGKYSGAVADGGTLTVCPDEYPDDIVAALAIVAPYNDEYVLTLPGSEYTEAVIEEYFRDLLGLGADWDFYVAWFNDADQYTGNDVAIGFRTDDVNGEGRTYVIGYEIVLKIEEPINDPMPQEIDDRFEELACVAHGKLDLAFGTSGTITTDTLGNLLTDLFGYTAEVDASEIDRIKDEYGGLGGGQTAWVDAVEVTFYNDALGTEYVKEMDMAFFKNLFQKYSGAVADGGTLTVCPDEYPDDIVAALAIVAPYNDEYVLTLPGDEYTEAVIEEYFRDLLGLGADWDFYLAWFNDADQYTGNDVAIGFRTDDVNGEGRTYVIGYEIVLKIEEPINDPMPQEIDDRFEELACVAHGKLDLVFGTSGTITTDTLGALLTELFGYTAEVDASEIQRIKDEYGGLGNGQTAWVDAVEVTFYNDALGTEYVKEMDLALMKMVYGKYAGAIEDGGFFGCCPDEWPADAAAAGFINNWHDSTEIEMPGDEYTPAAIEAWLRGETGLGDEWTFFIAWYDADAAYTGNEIAIAFIYSDVNGEGRTIILAGGPILHIATVPYVAGDITGNGSVDIGDLLRFLKYLSGAEVNVNEAALDVNGDGVVDIRDLIRLMKYLAGAGVEIH